MNDNTSLTSHILAHLVILLLIWVVFWSFIYRVAGIYVSSISINNGILFNNINIHNSKIKCDIKSFRFRLWGNSRKLIINGLQLNIEQSSSKSSRPHQKSSDDSFDLNIYPSNIIGRIAVKLVLKVLPNVDTEFKNVSVIYNDKVSSVDYVRFASKSRYSTKDFNNLKIAITVVANHISSMSSYQKENIFPLISISALKLDFKFSINVKDGLIHSIKIKLFTDDFRLLLFKFLKLYINDIEALIDKPESNREFSTEEDVELEEMKIQKREKRLRRIMKMFYLLYNSVEEITLLNQNINFFEIPFLTTEFDEPFTDYLKAEYPITSLELLVKSCHLNILKLSNDSAGFHALFDSVDDSPINFSSSVQLLTLHYSKLVELNGYLHRQKEEVLNLPTYALNFKANYLDKLARGEGFEKCVAELFFTSSSPVLDLNSNFLTSMVYNIIILAKFFKFKKVYREYKKVVNFGFNLDDEVSGYVHESDDDDADIDDTFIDTSDKEEPAHLSLKDKLWKYLQDYYPKLDVKFVIEQPRLIVRHTTPTFVEILNLSYSTLNLQVTTTQDRSYDFACQILSPTLAYIQKIRHGSDLNQFEVIATDSITAKIDILKNFKFKFDLQIHAFKVNLTDLKIFVGIKTIISELTTLIEGHLKQGYINGYLNSKISKYQTFISQAPSDKKAKPSSPIHDRIFSKLPSWFVEFNLSIDGIDVKLGSRSVLIPVQELTKSYINQDFSDFIRSDENKKSTELRCFRFTLDALDFSFKNDDSNLNFVSKLLLDGDSVASSETLASTAQSDTLKYWNNGLILSDIKFSTMAHWSSERKYENVIDIPKIDINVDSKRNGLKDSLNICTNINEFYGKLDHFKIFTIIGSAYLLKESIFNPIAEIKQKLKKDSQRINMPVKNTKSKPSLIDSLIISNKIKRTEIGITLNDDYDMKFESFDTKFSFNDKNVVLLNKFMRVLTKSPTLDNYWCRLLCADDFHFQVNLNNIKELYVNTTYLKFVHPYMYTTYKLFDNLSITVKVLKHSIIALKYDKVDKNQDFTVVYPSESKPKAIPDIIYKTKRLVFSMEDDPFESELGMIYQLGRVEQRKRLELYNLFEVREQFLESQKNKQHKKDTESTYTSDSSTSSIEDVEEPPSHLADLDKIISASWISKIKRYKTTLNDEIVKNKKFLFGNEAKLDPKFQKNVQPYSLHAPLLQIVMDGLNLKLSKPKFDLQELPRYLHDMGQGLPMDTKFSLIIPTFVNMRLQELRIHLRDYPVPLLYVPNTNNSTESAVKMAGNLVIAETLVTTKENIRKLPVNLVKNLKTGKFSNYYRLEIEKTLTTVKLYTDMSVEFKSTAPSRFVWGQSFQFGIQQAMLNFDQFSKPPVDPSAKVGFWDKLRLVLHGKFVIKCSQGPLEVAFKGSRDPYDLFGVSSGFILSFTDNVVWTINENDDSRNFCDVKAETVAWYIPNYLATGLVSWIRESKKMTYLPKSDKFITSCYAYYLEDEDYVVSKAKLDPDVYEKKVVSLSGGVNFKVGFVLQRKDPDGHTTEECRPHYDVTLFNPKYTEEGHDSYKGFRSDFVNMAISLDANFLESYNSIHLSPNVFMQFFSWWKLFSGNLQLPVRRGKIFGEVKESTKLSQHLVSNRFRFNFKSLFISHVYRDENTEDDDKIQFYGLRGKMESFVVDLHQRKEERIAVHEGLSRNKKIMKMNFHIGDVHLNGIDLRLISATFDENLYGSTNGGSKELDSKYETFDNDQQWFDIEDYEEAFLTSLRDCKRKIQILPLLYSRRFSYLRDTEPDVRFTEIDLFNLKGETLKQLNDVFEAQKDTIQDRIKQLKERVKHNKNKGLSVSKLVDRINMLTKEIDKLTKNESSFVDVKRRNLISNLNAKFNNKFVLIRMLMKWNNKNRNLFFRYIHFVQLRSFMKKYLSFESISALEEIINKADEMVDGGVTESENGESAANMRFGTNNKRDRHKFTNEDVLSRFDDILTEISSNEQIREDYLVEIVSPQIQFQSDKTPDSIVILSAPSIDAKVVSVYDKTKDRDLLDIDELENRFGVIVHDSNVLVFEKDKTLNSKSFIFDQSCYGSTTNWPPWLGIEICNEAKLAGDQNVLLENTSVVVTYTEMKSLGTKISKMDQDDSSDYQDAESEFSNRELGSEDIEKKLRVDIPRVNITSTSSQYYTLYSIIMDLLLYTEPSNKLLNEKLEKLKFSLDFQDISSLYRRIRSLHDQKCILDFMGRNYSFRQEHINNEDLNQYLTLQQFSEEISNEIYLLLYSLLSGGVRSQDSGKKPKAEWIINAHELILHMLEDDRTPILDIAMAKGKFRRIVNEDDSNINRIEVSMIQGFNLLRGARFPAFLEPMNHSDSTHDQNLITVDWSMYSNVGGIKVIENFEINSQPLSLRLDKITGDRLMEFLFRTSISDDPINQIKDIRKGAEENKHSNSDEEYIDIDEEDEEMSDSTYRGIEQGQVRFSNDDGGSNSHSMDSHPKKGSIRGSQSKAKSGSHSSNSDLLEDENLDEMVQRSKNYVSIHNLKINPVSLLISIKLKGGYKRLLNVEAFNLVLPEIIIQEKVLSVLELTMMLKKILIRTILGHAGGLLKNKMKRAKNRKSNTINKPLKPLKTYGKFTPISELRQVESKELDKDPLEDISK